MRTLAAVVLLAAVAVAQDPRARVRVESKEPVAPGQPVRVIVEILVPTWFTRAPRWPEMDVANAIAVLPAGSTTNLSEEGWTGLAREYVVCPLGAGMFTVPPLSVAFQYSVDGTPSRFDLRTPTAEFRAAVPDGAKGTRFAITTAAFTLEEKVEPPTLRDLKVGDAVTRTITMTAKDTFGLFLPPVRFAAPEGLALYPAQPRLEDKGGERGEARVATRVETFTYMIERGGSYTLPAVRVPWWNLAKKKLETAELPEHRFEVPALPAPVPARETVWWPWVVLAAAVLLGWTLRKLPGRWLRARAESESRYFGRFERACRGGDPKDTWRTLHAWFDKAGHAPPDDPQLAALDAHLYGSGEAWSPNALIDAMARTRRDWQRRPAVREHGLARLNP